MTISYTLVYSNVGTAPATEVVITETVPADTSFVADESSAGWSCSTGLANDICTYKIAEVPPSQKGVVIFTVQIDLATRPGNKILNRAYIGTRFGRGEANNGNNVGEFALTVNSPTATDRHSEPQLPLNRQVYLPYVKN